jgi:hypothetical protein
MCALPEHPNPNHEDAKDTKVAHGQARSCVAQAEAQSSKSFLVLFFKKEQKRKRFFFEKKKQKTFDY